jgi:hypothetical protein
VIAGALRSCSRVRRFALKDAAFSELGKTAVALQASLIAFLVGGAFVIFHYNEMLWHMIGLTIILERLAAQRQAEILSSKLSGSSMHPAPDKRRVAA